MNVPQSTVYWIAYNLDIVVARCSYIL